MFLFEIKRMYILPNKRNDGVKYDKFFISPNYPFSIRKNTIG